MMNCRRCNRPLKREPGVSTGIGPICAGKEKFETESRRVTMEILPYDGGDIFCQRKEDIKVTNVPWAKTYHSPDGYEWGYGGSGPADFALNILMLFVPENEAFELHQEFKWKFVATLPQEGGTIKRTDIEAWIKEYRRTA